MNRFSGGLFSLLLALTAGYALADDDDHLQARQLVEAGAILPLEQLLQQLQQEYPGRVLEVELERKAGGYRYELEILNQQGEVWELQIDAVTGELLDREQED